MVYLSLGQLDLLSVPYLEFCMQGSGWAWLGLNPSDKSLIISTTPNQDILDKQVRR